MKELFPILFISIYHLCCPRHQHPPPIIGFLSPPLHDHVNHNPRAIKVHESRIGSSHTRFLLD
ncbi:hypothetical protein BDW42DRAFT_173904 [Aspergillus taichungensis]|uniref:Uncharacterized protein n=1 Tax=Aspergillus taichungensis TaxID=482145 RepID=A0A2J5HP47_9EURO|nr:hypothetical protein BDW42DRAFT_173904 [Aspergillus taichungensis]